MRPEEGGRSRCVDRPLLQFVALASSAHQPCLLPSSILSIAIQIWQEAIDAAAAEAPQAASAISSNAVQQEDEVTHTYQKNYKHMGASTVAGLLRNFFVASGDLLWTPVSRSGRIIRRLASYVRAQPSVVSHSASIALCTPLVDLQLKEAPPPESLPERELALGDSQFMVSDGWLSAVAESRSSHARSSDPAGPAAAAASGPAVRAFFGARASQGLCRATRESVLIRLLFVLHLLNQLLPRRFHPLLTLVASVHCLPVQQALPPVLWPDVAGKVSNLHSLVLFAWGCRG